MEFVMRSPYILLTVLLVALAAGCVHHVQSAPAFGQRPTLLDFATPVDGAPNPDAPPQAAPPQPASPTALLARATGLAGQLMESTFRIAGATAQGGKSAGTCFLVAEPLPDTPSRGRPILVTAAHVLQDIATDTASILLRIATPDGRIVVQEGSLKIRDKGVPLWTQHPEADVAVMRVPMFPVVPQPTLLPVSALADDGVLQQFEVQPGDELMCLGFPFGYPSSELGFPILRSGKIASYPLTPTLVTRTMLFDMSVFGGNSGGPVFFMQHNRTYGGGMHVGQVAFLAGLVSQETRVNRAVQGFDHVTQESKSLALAVVVHASMIRQTIDLLPPADVTKPASAPKGK